MSGKTVKTVWEVATYDVWGNAKDGYEVNNNRHHGSVEIVCKIETCNIGTPHEFKCAGPSLYQIKKVFGVRCDIAINGDGMIVYVNRSRDSYPIGELRCISHKSLSPIQSL